MKNGSWIRMMIQPSVVGMVPVRCENSVDGNGPVVVTPTRLEVHDIIHNECYS